MSSSNTFSAALFIFVLFSPRRAPVDKKPYLEKWQLNEIWTSGARVMTAVLGGT